MNDGGYSDDELAGILGGGAAVDDGAGPAVEDGPPSIVIMGVCFFFPFFSPTHHFCRHSFVRVTASVRTPVNFKRVLSSSSCEQHQLTWFPNIIDSARISRK